MRYGFALSVSALALALTQWIVPFVGGYAFDLFQGAVVLSAWYGGLGPGFLTAGASLFALDYFLIPPLHSLSLGMADLFRLVVFGSVAILTSSLSEGLRRERNIRERIGVEKEILEVTNREQHKIGQELHDGLCQTLAGLRLIGDSLRSKLVAKSLPEVKDVELMERRLTEALAQADMVSRGLYPVELETNGLMAALEEMAAKTSSVYSVACRFRCRTSVLIQDGSVATHLYRIAQEAVMNAIKGGKARRIAIGLSEAGGRVALSIVDDGVGLKWPLLRRGMGLKIMDYRAHLIGATLRFQSRPRGCTRVSCSLSPRFEEGVSHAVA